MSAISGTLAALAIVLKAAVESSSGQDTRTRSTPASSQRRIWSIVAPASEVGVLVMVWTLIGASPPISSPPTVILRLLRRSIIRQGRTLRGSGLEDDIDTLPHGSHQGGEPEHELDIASI